jgi:hypothetical protein
MQSDRGDATLVKHRTFAVEKERMHAEFESDPEILTL